MNHKVNTRTDTGFTLIELMLAMTFISILLLTIALTIVQIANIYNQGTISREVNQTSRVVSTTLQDAINSSSSFSLNAADHHYVQTFAADGTTVIGGRLCVGAYSYIWNYAPAINPSTLNGNRNVYIQSDATISPNLPLNTITTGTHQQYEIAFVKAADTGGAYCTKDASSGNYPPIDQTKATEILRSGDHSFALHYMNITTAATATDTLSAQQMYTVTFVMGTADPNAVTGTGENILCKGPGVPGSDVNYCNVQKFTLVLRVASGVN